jgi:uncharacterized protein with PIN domain
VRDEEKQIGEQDEINAQDKYKCVTLILYKDPKSKKFIRCMYCGKKLFVLTGEGIEVIFEARYLETDQAIDVFCDRCRVIYRTVNNTLVKGNV